MKKISKNATIVIIISVVFSLLLSAVLITRLIKINSENKKEEIFNEYRKILDASGEVGNFGYKSVLPFGDWQIVLTSSYIDAARDILKAEDYDLFANAFIESTEWFNNLKIGYRFKVCSEDNSFGFPVPDNGRPRINWDLLDNSGGDLTVGEWVYNKDIAGERFSFYQIADCIASINYPAGCEKPQHYDSLNGVKTISVYGEEFSASRLFYTFRILIHEIEHSIGVKHIDLDKNIVPKNEGGVLETYMSEKINIFYVGNSQYDINTLIVAASVRKILDGTKDSDDKNFDSHHLDKLDELLKKGNNALGLS